MTAAKRLHKCHQSCDHPVPALNFRSGYKTTEWIGLFSISFNNYPGADIPHVRLAVRYAQVRSLIDSRLRTNDTLFGCTSGCGRADSAPARWVVQSPGVTDNGVEPQ